MYFQLSNKQAEWNKLGGWTEPFIYDLKKLEQVWQNFRLIHEKIHAGGGGFEPQKSISKLACLLDR